jgi:hypothetical protein
MDARSAAIDRHPAGESGNTAEYPAGAWPIDTPGGRVYAEWADEGRQETVVDVDDATGEILAEVVGQDLHETGENDQLDILLDNQPADLREAVRAVLAILIGDIAGDLCNDARLVVATDLED